MERWTLNTDDLFATHPRTTIRFLAKNQFGDTVSPLALDLQDEVSLEKVLNADPQAVRLPIDELPDRQPPSSSQPLLNLFDKLMVAM